MKKKASALNSLLFLLLLGVGFTVFLFAAADQFCRYDISKRLPYYPNAQLISQEKDSLRYRAIGTSHMVFHSNDDPETVAQWYQALNLEQLNKGIFRGLADIKRWHEPETTGGTTIYYRTACGI
jgi:hypothetical protein